MLCYQGDGRGSLSPNGSGSTCILDRGIDPAKPSQELTGKLREADLQVTRLPPSAFPELPKSIRRELERRGCTIPQVWADKKPQNVIKGEFTRKGQYRIHAQALTDVALMHFER